MQTVDALQKGNPETTVAAKGKVTRNPLEQPAVELKQEAWQRLQKKANPLQPQKNSTNPLQPGQPVNIPFPLPAKATTAPQQNSNNTGLPNQLKAGLEALSGYSMDNVKVHYNSSQPAQLQALAYAQGNNIHLAPGQQQHLPHEAWHVVQQKQGRVQPLFQQKGVSVNDNASLEQEADVKGKEAAQYTGTPITPAYQLPAQQAVPPVQLISDYSRAVLETLFIPLLQTVVDRVPDLPEGFEQEIITVRNFLNMGDSDEPEWYAAGMVISYFIDTVFSKHQLGLAVEILNNLHGSVNAMGGVSAGPLAEMIENLGGRKHRLTAMEEEVDIDPLTVETDKEGNVDIDPLTVDQPMAPQPLLRGLIWNLHGFSNVQSKEDREDFKLIGKGEKKQEDRRLFVNAIINKIAESSKEVNSVLRDFEKDVAEAIQEENSDRVESLASLPLNSTQINDIYEYVKLQDKSFQRDFAIQVGHPGTYQVKANRKQKVLAALKNYQSDVEEDSPEYKKIDNLLERIQSAKLLDKFRRKPHYISNLLNTVGHLSIPDNPSEKFLLKLIGRVKELRNAIKLLSAFQNDNYDIDTPSLHKAFDTVSRGLNVSINQNTTEKHATNDKNLAVYLDKELNKYAIVSHLTSLLNDNRLDLDFMLLNEMNRGINSFTKEVVTATRGKYGVARGPQMSAMRQDGTRSQREYYPLVYNTEKFRLSKQRSFYVGVKNGQLTVRGVAEDEELPWMKPENKKEGEGNDDYLDYRPIIVHRLIRKDIQDESEKNQIWLAAVHTTPYGTEFDRKKIYEELEAPLRFLQAKAKKSGATLIIGGDFYIAAEALAKKPLQNAFMSRLATEKDDKRNQWHPSEGNQNEDRNLRDQKGNVHNLTKLLSGDSNPVSGWKNTKVGMGLQDVRSVTGTNKNSKGLQSADYFVVPDEDKDRVRAGLIDPRTRDIVELETDDQQISRHNFHFSDHLIGAIEVYATKEEKKEAQLYGKMKNNIAARMYQQQITKLGDNPKSSKYEIGDFEPQPGLASIITTLLFQIWEIINTAEAQHTSSTKDLLGWIDKTRQDLKKEIAYDPRLHKEDLVSLLSELKNLKNKTIDEYAGIISELMDNYIKKDSSYSDRLKRTELVSKKKPMRNKNKLEYPLWDRLPSLLRIKFKENLVVGNKLIAKNDTEAILHLCAYYMNTAALNDFASAMLHSRTGIDDPKVIALMNQKGISVSFYSVAFFEETLYKEGYFKEVILEKKPYTSFLKSRYGNGDTHQIKILYVDSGLLTPACPYAGYYML